MQMTNNLNKAKSWQHVTWQFDNYVQAVIVLYCVLVDDTLFSMKIWKKYQMMRKWAENWVSGVLTYAESESENEICIDITFEQMHQISHL